SENYSLRRIAAEIWGRIGEKQKDFAVHNLSQIAQTYGGRPIDRVLEHSITYALIEIHDPKTTSEFLTNSPAHQRIGLIALDQMENGNLKPEQVAPHLLSTNAALKETASWIVSHHPEWGDALTGFFRDALAKKEISEKEKSLLNTQLAQLASNSSIQELLATTLQSGLKKSQHIALGAMAQSGIKPTPASWSVGVLKILESGEKEFVPEAIAVARAGGATKENSAPLTAALLKIANDKTQPDELRLNALAASPGAPELNAELFDFLRANLDSTKSVITRGNATALLARAKLNQEQLLQMIESLKNAGPMEAMKLMNVFEKSTNEIVGVKLATELKEAKTFKTMRVERLKPLFAKYPTNVQAEAEKLYPLLNA
ncbi:MAG: PVC-type heme-binding CxxCH protein, partial [Limisphaerales bacterium]